MNKQKEGHREKRGVAGHLPPGAEKGRKIQFFICDHCHGLTPGGN